MNLCDKAAHGGCRWLRMGSMGQAIRGIGRAPVRLDFRGREHAVRRSRRGVPHFVECSDSGEKRIRVLCRNESVFTIIVSGFTPPCPAAPAARVDPRAAVPQQEREESE